MLEEGKWHELDNRWRARSDKPHTSGMKPHTHVYLKGRQAFVINDDGTPSHGSDLSKMPANVRQMLADKKLIEGAMTESASATSTALVPAVLIAKAVAAVRRANMIAAVIATLKPSR